MCGEYRQISADYACEYTIVNSLNTLAFVPVASIGSLLQTTLANSASMQICLTHFGVNHVASIGSLLQTTLENV